MRNAQASNTVFCKLYEVQEEHFQLHRAAKQYSEGLLAEIGSEAASMTCIGFKPAMNAS